MDTHPCQVVIDEETGERCGYFEPEPKPEVDAKPEHEGCSLWGWRKPPCMGDDGHCSRSVPCRWKAHFMQEPDKHPVAWLAERCDELRAEREGFREVEL